MSRKALIISNPGEGGAENYCDGVFRDVDNYKSFLTSACGGLWSRLDIDHLPRPSIAEARQAIRKLEGSDYALVVFTGHGWFSTGLDSTILTLKHGQEIDSIELQEGAPKQTVILDCCRLHFPGLPLDESIIINASGSMLKRAASRLNPEQCRRYLVIAVSLWGAILGLFSYGLRNGIDKPARVRWLLAQGLFCSFTAGLASYLVTSGDKNRATGVTIFALVGGFFSCVPFLEYIETKSPNKVSTSGGASKIHDAAQNGDFEKVKAILKETPDSVYTKDVIGRTPLHWAARNGHKDVAVLLIANKAEINAKDNNNGRTPLYLALDNNHNDTAVLLRQHGGQE